MTNITNYQTSIKTEICTMEFNTEICTIITFEIEIFTIMTKRNTIRCDIYAKNSDPIKHATVLQSSKQQVNKLILFVIAASITAIPLQQMMPL